MIDIVIKSVQLEDVELLKNVSRTSFAQTFTDHNQPENVEKYLKLRKSISFRSKEELVTHFRKEKIKKYSIENFFIFKILKIEYVGVMSNNFLKPIIQIIDNYFN